jgi:hypothetical protein
MASCWGSGVRGSACGQECEIERCIVACYWKYMTKTVFFFLNYDTRFEPLLLMAAQYTYI